MSMPLRRIQKLQFCCTPAAALAEEVRAGQKRLAEAQTALAAAKAAALAANAQTLPNGARHLVARVDGIDAKGLQVRMGKRQAEGVVPSHCAVSACSPMSIYQNIASRSQATGIHCKAKAHSLDGTQACTAASSDAFISYTSHRRA